MKYAYGFDDNFFFTRQIPYEDSLPKHSTDTPLPEGLFRPKWDSVLNKWIEGASSEYINKIKNPIKELNEIEKTQKALAELTIQLVLNEVI